MTRSLLLRVEAVASHDSSRSIGVFASKGSDIPSGIFPRGERHVGAVFPA